MNFRVISLGSSVPKVKLKICPLTSLGLIPVDIEIVSGANNSRDIYESGKQAILCYKISMATVSWYLLLNLVFCPKVLQNWR